MGGGDNAVTVNASIDAEGFEKGTKRIEDAVNSLGKTVNGVFGEIKQFISSLDFEKIGKALRSGDFKEFGEQIRNAMQEAAEAAQSMGDAAAPDLGDDEPIKAKSKAFESLRAAAQKARSAIQSIAGTIGRVAQGAVTGARGIIRTFSNLVSGARNTSRGINQGAQLATGGIKKLTSLLLGVGSAYSIISKAVSSFMSENQALSAKMGSIWTALGNLLGPIISQVISLITSAISYFIAFLNLLGITAKTASQASKSAKGAGSELKKTIAGFDELNILQEGGGGGGGSGTLDDKEPPDWVKDIAKLLKEHQWAKAGQVLADKLNEMIAGVDWKGIGEKIGFYLNGALEFIDAVIEGFHWDKLGQDLAEFANKLFGQLNGEVIGRLLIAPFTKGFTLLTNFLATLDTTLIAEKISDALVGALTSVKNTLSETPFYEIGGKIKAFFEGIKWEDIRDAIFGVLEAAWNGAVALLEGLLGLEEGEATPEKVGAKVREFFENIKWGEIASAIFQALNKAWKLAIGFFKGLLGLGDGDASSSAVGTKISGFFEKINWDDVKSAILTGLKTAWNGALSLFKGLLTVEGEEIPMVAALKSLLDSIEAFAASISSNWEEKIKPVLEWTVNTALPGFFEALAGTISDLAAILNGDMNFGQFIMHMNGLEAALTLLFAVKIGTWGVEVATGIKRIIDVFTVGGAATGGVAVVNVIRDFWAALQLGAEAIGGIATIGPVAVVGLAAIYANCVVNAQVAAALAEAFDGLGDSTEDVATAAQRLAEKYAEQKVQEEELAQCGADLTMIQNGLDTTTIAYNDVLDQLAVQLGISTDELRAQIEAAGGDVTQIEALKGATDNLSGSQNQLNQVMVDHLKHLNESGALTETYLNSLMQQGMITKDYADLLKEMGFVIAENGEVVKEVTDAVEGQADALTAGAAATEGAAKAASDLAENLDDTPSSAKAAGDAVIGVGEDTETGTGKAEVEVADYVDTVGSEFDDLVDTVTEDSEDMKDAVSDTWTDISPEMLASISEMVEVIKEFVTENGSSIKDFAENIRNEIVDSTSSMATTFSAKFEEMGTTVSDFTGEAQTKIEDSTEAMDSAFTEKFDSMTSTTSDFAKKAKDKLDSFASRTVKDMEDLVSAIKSVWDTAEPAIQSSIDGIRSAVSFSFLMLRTEAYVWGVDLIINLNNGIVAAWNTLVPTISAVAAMIRSYLGFSEPEKGPLSDFHTYAPDMIDLFAKGVRDNMGKVEDAVGDMAEGISDALQGDELTGSVSLGIGDQIESSIEGKKPQLIAAAHDLAVGISDAIQSEGYGFNYSDGFDTVMDNFADKVVNGFAEMCARLQAIADNVVFSMPVVAGGGFLPYGVNDNPFGLNPMDERESELMQAVGDLRELVSEFMYAVDHMQWVAQFDDFKTIAARVTKIQKQEDRSRGY